jgi:hypothetical protein
MNKYRKDLLDKDKNLYLIKIMLEEMEDCLAITEAMVAS